MPVGALYLSLAETCFYINFLIGLIELFINAEFPIGSACMHFLSFFFEKFAVNFLTLATHLILKETINGSVTIINRPVGIGWYPHFTVF